MILSSFGLFIWSWLAYGGPYTAVATIIDSRVSPYTPQVDILAICREIAFSVSSASDVFFPGTGQYEYEKDISHYAVSSTQEATCSFEPGTSRDVGLALQILGRTRCPFAVKGGGHTTNPGFSSTLGVQIAMHRFSDVIYDNITQTADVGAGLIWDDVYAALEPYGVNVAGGRVSGIGVGGFTLGGGYSWHANQYGLTIDTVEAFELVLPNGTVANIDASQDDLFFALKGGFNNFGVVTRFMFKTFPQALVWGGTIIYNESEVNQLTKAAAKFVADNKDPRANILVSFVYAHELIISEGTNEVMLFYDAPSPPPGLFDDFLSIFASNIEVHTRSFLSLVRSSSANLATGSRMAFQTVSVLGYPEDFLWCMVNESIYWGTTLPLGLGFVAVTAEPFLQDVYNHNSSPSAWPGSRAFFSPLNIAFAWSGDGSTDHVMISALKQSAATLQENAYVPEQLSMYGNYALADTPLEVMYGRNIGRLKRIARAVDPQNVMGLAGGFKF